MFQKRTTRPSEIEGLITRGQTPVAAREPRQRTAPRRWAQAVCELCRHAGRVQHVPKLAQLAFMAAVRGREPVSYELDPDRNWLPESLPVDFPLGTQGLAVRWADADGLEHEAVALPHGLAFELL